MILGGLFLGFYICIVDIAILVRFQMFVWVVQGCVGCVLFCDIVATAI